ncbi:hypothetical protein BJ322DRAFT_1110128 [Thelephora terrestris]|uniref:Uncharacterized protein n=1 Tax=Thelephora terrestris TaxID=56493 RepID=A0A9P6L5K3_9AGAM|nr:hypothetical protein BJ322DRAFT_1110128 [Thelephora terrestris]
MITDGITKSNLALFDDNNDSATGLGFNGVNYPANLLNVAGPSQPSTGSDLWVELESYPGFCSPSRTLLPAHEAYPDESRNSPSYQGMGMPTFSPQLGTLPLPSPRLDSSSPILTLSYGQSYTTSTPSASYPYNQPQAATEMGDLGLGFPTLAESFHLPDMSPPPAHNPLYEPYPQTNSLHLDLSPPGLITGELCCPTPVASSSTARRTRQPVREGRRYDPVKWAKKVPDSDKGGWNQTLVRFQANFGTEFSITYSVHNGQPSGGLVLKYCVLVVYLLLFVPISVILISAEDNVLIYLC